MTARRVTAAASLACMWLVAVCPAFGQSTNAGADDDDGRERADAALARGLAHYDDREFERAIEQFAAGYRADPRPAFLFALAQSERRSGDCRTALIYYRKFLAADINARQARAAREQIARCRAALASGPRLAAPIEPDAPTPADDGPDAEPADDPTPVPSAPWYRDPWGGALLGAGVTAGIASAALLYASRTSRNDADLAVRFADYRRMSDRATDRRALGVGAGIVGAALVAGAVIRYGLVGRTGADPAPVAIAPVSGGGLAVTVAGGF